MPVILSAAKNPRILPALTTLFHPTSAIAEPYTSTVTPLSVYEAIGFILGLAFGSFLNVCISRLPNHESVVHPRSRCPQCKAPIRWYDNIPLLSWLFLRGRCRNCKQSIPWRYPLVELAVGLWFWITIATFLSDFSRTHDFGNPFSSADIPRVILAIAIAILGFLLIGLMVMDWQTLTLPNAFTLTGIAIALFLICTQAIFLGPTEDQVLLTKHSLHLTSPGGVTDHGNVFLTGPESLIFGRIAAICGAALILLLVRWLYKALRHREGMGLGDVKLLAMIAAFLGFWPAALALFIGVLTASIYGILLLARGKAVATSKLAFGSFLAIGGLISAQFGDRIINMYSALLR
jgi:leader peptidase (prepilin peptidase)/N-methyltransferase